jgi:hypothetical protein
MVPLIAAPILVKLPEKNMFLILVHHLHGAKGAVAPS